MTSTEERSRTYPAIVRYVPQLVICTLGAVLLWHCRHGLIHSDEAFYLALVHRFWMGDRLLIDEWQIAQLYAPILLPAYSLFRLVVPSGDGVYLAFRVLYVLLSLVSPLLLLAQADRDRMPKVASLVAATLLLLYSRANINGCSYYNLCLHFLTLSVLLLYLPSTAANEEGAATVLDRVRQVAAGVCFALACICCPPLVLFLPAYLLLARHLEPSSMRFVVGGGLSCVALYLVPILTKASLPQLIAAAQTVLSDPEHQQGFVKRAATVAFFWLRHVSLAVIPFALLGAVEEAFTFRRGTQGEGGHRAWQAVYLAILAVMVLYTARMARTSICFVVAVPAATLLLPFVMHAALAREGRIPCSVALYLAGVALAISFFFGSNTGLDAMTGGFALGTVGGILCCAEQVSERRQASLISVLAAGVLAVTSLVLVGTFAAHRLLGTYRDAPLEHMVYAVDDGPGAGLLTTQEHREAYLQIVEALRSADEESPEGGLLVSRLLPYGYLVTGRPCASPTAWSIPLSDSRLMSYYEEEGHAFPRLVLIVEPRVGGFETAPFNNHAGKDEFNFNELEGPFYDWLMDNSTLLTSNEYLKLYRVNDDVFDSR